MLEFICIFGSQNGAVSHGVIEMPRAAPRSTSHDTSPTPWPTRPVAKQASRLRKRHMLSYAYPASDVRAPTSNLGDVRMPVLGIPELPHRGGVVPLHESQCQEEFSLTPPGRRGDDAQVI